MKKFLFLTTYSLLLTTYSHAQHCPWDCSGMIVVETNVTREKIAELHPFLADEKGKGICDTIYDSGIEHCDACKIKHYDDFMRYRKKKAEAFYHYKYDTAYYFAEGKYIVKYNYCLFQNKKLYISFVNPYRRDLHYEMIEVPENKRIHLHDYNNLIRERNYTDMDTLLQPYILKLNCVDLGLYEDDCR